MTTTFPVVVTLGWAIFAVSAAHGGDAGKPRSVAVYALSRGTGVPPATRETYQKARALLRELEQKNEVAGVEEKRIGLEGESRVCAELTDAKNAQAVIAKLRALAQGVDLLNVVEEPCRTSD